MSSITFSGTPVDTTPLPPGSMTFNYGSIAVDSTFPVNVDLPPVVKVDFTSMTIFEYAVAYKTLMQKLTLPAGFGQNGTSFGFCFYKCESLQKLALPAGFGQYGARFSACFQGCAKLAELALPPDGKFMAQAATTSNMFYGCTSLSVVTGAIASPVGFSLEHSPKLTRNSLLNIINGLVSVTTPQTLALGSTNLAKLTDDEKKIATGKGWTLT